METQPIMDIKEIENLVELPLKLVLNKKTMSDMLCTPRDIENLFRGWLFSQGYIEKASDIKSISFDIKTLTVNVEATTKEPEKTPLLSDLASIALNNAESLNPKIIDNSKIYNKYLKITNEYGALLHSKRTKGLHAALICNGDTIIFKEDVSRHCAIDKAVGECIIKGIEPKNSILVTTGRISTEFLFKAKMLDIPMIASLKYPSVTGEIIAKEWQINLATHINSQNAKILLHSIEKINRII